MMTDLEPRGDSPIADPAVRRQLAQLFGAELFGPWPELEQHVVPPRRRRRLRGWLVKFAIFAALVLLVWGGERLLRPGLARQVDEQRRSYAAELQTFLNDGSLDRAAEFVVLVRDTLPEGARPAGEKRAGAARAIAASDPERDLLLNAEAKLYRHYDADPARLERIRTHLEGVGVAQPQRLIASLTLLSWEERAARLPELERLHAELPNRNDVEYLLATALSSRGDDKSARIAWESSDRLGPAWLGHRFEQAWFELLRGQKEAAQKIGVRMRRVDPDSPWSRLAVVAFAIPEDQAVPSIRADGAAPVTGAVLTHFEQLERATAAGQRKDWAEAKQRLDAAIAAAHEQPPFLLDAFDWLLAARLPELARHLSAMPAWPSANATAAAKIERLRAAEARDIESNAASTGPRPAPLPSAANLQPKSPRAAGKRKAVRRATR